jgi:hypothetical protein
MERNHVAGTLRYYGTPAEVLPARIRRPRDKAKVEAGVASRSTLPRSGDSTRTVIVGAAGPAIYHREPPGGQRHNRRGLGRARPA